MTHSQLSKLTVKDRKWSVIQQPIHSVIDFGGWYFPTHLNGCHVFLSFDFENHKQRPTAAQWVSFISTALDELSSELCRANTEGKETRWRWMLKEVCWKQNGPWLTNMKGGHGDIRREKIIAHSKGFDTVARYRGMLLNSDLLEVLEAAVAVGEFPYNYWTVQDCVPNPPPPNKFCLLAVMLMMIKKKELCSKL